MNDQGYLVPDFVNVAAKHRPMKPKNRINNNTNQTFAQQTQPPQYVQQTPSPQYAQTPSPQYAQQTPQYAQQTPQYAQQTPQYTQPPQYESGGIMKMWEENMVLIIGICVLLVLLLVLLFVYVSRKRQTPEHVKLDRVPDNIPPPVMPTATVAPPPVIKEKPQPARLNDEKVEVEVEAKSADHEHLVLTTDDAELDRFIHPKEQEAEELITDEFDDLDESDNETVGEINNDVDQIDSDFDDLDDLDDL